MSSRNKIVAHRAQPYMIIEATAKFFELQPEQLKLKSRRGKLLRPRQIAMYLIRRYCDEISLQDTGELFNRHHPSVHNAVTRVASELPDNPRLNFQIEEIVAALEDKLR